MKKLGTEMRRRIKRWEDDQAKAYAVAAVRAAVEAAPGPEKTSTSTGRARAAIAVEAGQPAGYTPPLARSYRRPTRADALRGIRGRRQGQSVFLDVGVPYNIYFIPLYPLIEVGHEAGLTAIQDDDGRSLRG